ncbi:unnamed protein product [Caretta caretta]
MNRGRGVNGESEWVSPETLKQETPDLKGENEKLRTQLQACLVGKGSQKGEEKAAMKVAKATVAKAMIRLLIIHYYRTVLPATQTVFSSPPWQEMSGDPHAEAPESGTGLQIFYWA